MKHEETLLHPLGEIDADGVHVPDDLVGRFLEGKIQASLTAPTGGVGVRRRQTCFACARCTGYKDGAATEEPFPTKHSIQPGDARVDALSGNRVIEPQDVMGRIERRYRLSGRDTRRRREMSRGT